MSRTLVRLAILLIAVAVPSRSLRAQLTYAGTISGPGTLTFTNTNANPGGPNSAGVINGVNPGTLILAGSNTYTGGTTVNAYPGGPYSASGVISGNGGALTTAGGGTLILSGSNTYTGNTTVTAGVLQGNWGVDTSTLDVSAVATPFGAGAGVSVAPTPSTPLTPIPAGPVFYVIIEGAGLGDSVRMVPCTGKETVLSAVGAVNGICQVSSTKMWIARPTPKTDKSTILTVDWEAISKRGINTTNYTLMPGDRLVFAADPLVTRTNLIGKKAATVERVDGIVSLTASVISSLQSTPGAGELVKELVEKGLISDDEELKQIVLDIVRCAEQHKKAERKSAEAPKANRGEEEPSAAGPKAAQVQGSFQVEIKSIAIASKASAEQKEAAPHELAMRPLPTYRIEPPDVIQVEMPKLAAGAQPVTGQYLVAPDGTINLRHYGLVSISGMTVAEARIAIQNHLKAYLAAPELAVDVVAYNSKVFYVITQGAGLGDNVRRLPITGKETVLDAISQVNGLSQVSSKNIWIARPSAADSEKGTILHVDWDAITSRAATATNYQLMPGDRVYVGEDPLVMRTNLMSQKTAPLERIMGIVSLTTSTVSSVKSTPAARELVTELVRKGLISDDEQLKQIVLETIRLLDEEGKKARPKAAVEEKRGR